MVLYTCSGNENLDLHGLRAFISNNMSRFQTHVEREQPVRRSMLKCQYTRGHKLEHALTHGPLAHNVCLKAWHVCWKWMRVDRVDLDIHCHYMYIKSRWKLAGQVRLSIEIAKSHRVFNLNFFRTYHIPDMKKINMLLKVFLYSVKLLYEHALLFRIISYCVK